MGRSLVSFVALSLVIVAACSDDSATPPTVTGVVDAGTDAPTEAGATCAPVVQECVQSICNSDGSITSTPQAAGTACATGVCDGKGVCTQKLGETCATNTECPTGFCVDGVCCAEACTGECKACNNDGSKGQCTNIAFLKEDVSYENSSGTKVDCTTAVGGARCDGKGKCLKTQGTTCVDDASCLGGKCSAANKCLGAKGEICDALADCVSNQCVMGTCQ